MALIPDFSITQTPGSPGSILIVDSSTGVDALVTSRRVYIQKSNGDYLVESGSTNEYITFSNFPSETSLLVENLLDYDLAVRCVIQWLDVSESVLYDKTSYIGFTCYNEDFDYELTQSVAGNPLLMSDNNFWGNKSLLRGYIDSGNNAIERNSDIAAGQQCYDLATNLREDSQYLFNRNS